MSKEILPEKVVHYYNGQKVELNVSRKNVLVKSSTNRFMNAVFNGGDPINNQFPIESIVFPKDMDKDGVFDTHDPFPDGILINNIAKIGFDDSVVLVEFNQEVDEEFYQSFFGRVGPFDFEYTFTYEDQIFLSNGAIILYAKEDLDKDLVMSSCPLIEEYGLNYWKLEKSNFVEKLYLANFGNNFYAQKVYEYLNENSPDWLICCDINYNTLDSRVAQHAYIEHSHDIEPLDLPVQKSYELTKTFEAHNKFSGNSDIKIAIFDTGIYDGHPDLKKAALTSMGDTPLPIFYINNNSDDPTLPFADNSHGTNCAGLACASRFLPEAKGVDGVGRGCSFIDVRIGYTHGTELHLDMFNLIEAFYKTGFGNNPANVISCSFKLSIGFNCLEQIINLVVNKGNNNKGVSVVFAAGNAGKQAGFPAFLESIVTVSATNHLGHPKIKGEKTPNQEVDDSNWGSNFGPKVDLAAPGTFIITTSNPRNTYENPLGYRKDFSGTSASAPQVAGCIGLMLSIDPDLRPEKIKSLLKNNTTEFPVPTEHHYGTGILNVMKTLENINSI